MLGSERRSQRIDIHHRSARSIDELCTRFHPRQFGCADHASRLRSFGNMQCDYVSDFKQRGERWHGSRVSQRQLGFDIVIHHLHSQRLSQ